MVMKTLDGSSSPLDCLINPLDCVFSDACAQQEVWKAVEEAVQNLLSSITLEHLTQRQRHLAGQAVL
jgi:DNA-binding IscR family transcriptional regulator